jgi:hypothetical protein
LSPSSHAPIPIQVGHFFILKTAIIKHSLFRRAKESRFEHTSKLRTARVEGIAPVEGLPRPQEVCNFEQRIATHGYIL